MIQLPATVHLALAWCAFTMLVIFIAKYGLGKRDIEMPQFNRGLAVRYLLAAGTAFWPLFASPFWRYLAIAPLLAVIIGLTMIQYGTRLEVFGESHRQRSNFLLGYGGVLAAFGLITAFVALNAALFLGAA